MTSPDHQPASDPRRVRPYAMTGGRAVHRRGLRPPPPSPRRHPRPGRRHGRRALGHGPPADPRWRPSRPGPAGAGAGRAADHLTDKGLWTGRADQVEAHRRAVQLVRAPVEGALSLPIQVAFELLGAGLAGLVPRAPSKQLPNWRKSLTLVAKKAPILAAQSSPITSASVPATRPATAWPRLSACPPVGPDDPHDAKARATRPRRAPSGANRINTTRTRATTPMTSAAVPMPLRRGRARQHPRTP